MAIADRVYETSTTTGTGTLNLAGAVTSFRTFVAGYSTGAFVPYVIRHQTLDQWEVGWGTVTDAATDTLSRDKVLASSNSNALVNFSAGTKDVFSCINAQHEKGIEKIHEAVRVATTAAGTLSTDYEAGDSVDGVTLSNGDRILVKNQATASENGIYIVGASGAPVRAPDFFTGQLFGNSDRVFCRAGTINGVREFYISNSTALTSIVGTTNQTWSERRLGPQAFDFDLNNNDLFNINIFQLRNRANLTIASGSVTITRTFNHLECESGTTDQLDTIAESGDWADGAELLFATQDPTDVINIRSSATIKTPDGLDVYLTNLNPVRLIRYSSVWYVQGPSITPEYTETDGATVTFDQRNSHKQRVVLGGNRTLALSNVPSVNGYVFTLKLVQDATGSRTVTWFSGISWAGGSAPTLTTTANKADRFTFFRTGSSTYEGHVVGQNI